MIAGQPLMLLSKSPALINYFKCLHSFKLSPVIKTFTTYTFSAISKITSQREAALAWRQVPGTLSSLLCPKAVCVEMAALEAVGVRVPNTGTAVLLFQFPPVRATLSAVPAQISPEVNNRFALSQPRKMTHAGI